MRICYRYEDPVDVIEKTVCAEVTSASIQDKFLARDRTTKEYFATFEGICIVARTVEGDELFIPGILKKETFEKLFHTGYLDLSRYLCFKNVTKNDISSIQSYLKSDRFWESFGEL